MMRSDLRHTPPTAAMQQSCQVCHKTVNYERGAVEVACPYCYTEYRIDGMGRLKMVDLFEEDEPLQVDDEPRPSSGSDRSDMARLMDDGADEHITFVKDTGDMKRAGSAAPGASTAPPVMPTGDIGSLEFADDDDGPKKAAGPTGATFSELTGQPGAKKQKKQPKQKKKPAAGPGPQPGRPASGKEREERPVQRKKRRKQRANAEALANHPQAFDIPDDMPQEDDSSQRALVGVVVVIVGVILFGALSAVAVIMLSGNPGDDRSSRQARDADDDDDSDGDTPVRAADDNSSGDDTNSLEAVIQKAEELLDAGSYEDACEAVLWLETAGESAELNATHRRRIDHSLTGARQVCDAWRLYEQGAAALDRADAATDPQRANYDRHFALSLLREASAAARRGPGFNTLRDRISEATARARAN